MPKRSWTKLNNVASFDVSRHLEVFSLDKTWSWGQRHVCQPLRPVCLMMLEECAGKWKGLIYWLSFFLSTHLYMTVSVHMWTVNLLTPLPLKPSDKNTFVYCGKQNEIIKKKQKNKTPRLLLTTSQLLILGRHWKFCPGYRFYGNDIWSVL